MRRSLPVGLSVASLFLLAIAVAPATAVTDRWADWDPITGSSNDYRTIMRQGAPGFPQATLASDSRANVQLAAGASTFLGASTPPGAKYGSSRGQSYIVLRPRADGPTTPSRSTYTFAAPTPDTGWAFVLGDVDSDQVEVSATDVEGDPVPAAAVDRWFRGPFNYAGETDQPTWEPDTSTLVGNAGAVDTAGASGWFEPDQSLTSLTMTFTRRAGFPVYQTWFVSRARPVTGVVTDASIGARSCPLDQTQVVLSSPYGEEIARTGVQADGSYDLGQFATQGGYVVRIRPPDSCAVLGASQRSVDNRGEDGSPGSQADFTVREIVPQAISGTVRDGDGNPVAGVGVTLTDPDDGTKTTTTGPDGTYLFDDNAEVPGYTIQVDVPIGFRPGPGGDTINNVDVEDQPIVNQDFVVVQLASVSGRVTGGGGGLAGVPVSLTPEGGGPALRAVTDADGRYSVPGVPPGAFTLAVDPPPGYAGGAGREITVSSDDLRGQNFALRRPGAVGGRVTTPDGETLAGVRIVVEGPGGLRRLTTDAGGTYFLDGLRPGNYILRVVPPNGQLVVGRVRLTATITRAGEIIGGRDFILDAAPAPPVPSPTPAPTPTPPGSPPASPSSNASGAAGPADTPSSGGSNLPGNVPFAASGAVGGAESLPETGGPAVSLGLFGGALLLAGGAVLGVARRRGRNTTA